jgi:acylpyruvate hydrolase
MTARNLQSKVKSLGLPWSAAKGFDGFTPISTTFLPSSDVKDPTDLRLTLAVNNEPKQDGKTKDMIFGIPRLLEHVSSIMTLEVRYDSCAPYAVLSSRSTQEGDLILTGTPSGVGPVNPGDHVSCTLEDIASGKTLATLEFDAVQRDGGYIFKH